jgi:hypothetical protein
MIDCDLVYPFSIKEILQHYRFINLYHYIIIDKWSNKKNQKNQFVKKKITG